ncbi:MAG: M42 family metallopeptidase [Oscillospiraceae bacterium]|nr:M42 family metallopeptidase [Oscillospiraceae bacterium]
MIDLLKQLCMLNGTSGDESRVAEFLQKNMNPNGAVIRRDSPGNLLVYKKGRHTPKNVVMFAAHMDEVGFIITDITEEGYLRFDSVGGISANAVFGRQVAFYNADNSFKTAGVIAGRPVHLLGDKDKSVQPKIEDLLIDIGADDKSHAESLVSRGDFCYFSGEFEEIENYKNLESYGARTIRSKAIDDRLGCAIMLDMIQHELVYDCAFAFTVQEEIGCRGAGAAAYNLEPDICIVLEATTACDTAGVADGDKVCEMGEGPVITFMDKGTAYDRGLYNLTVETAKENNMKVQTKSKIIGGNDASVLHKSAGGIRTVSVSAPCRYLHTASSSVCYKDVTDMRKLAERLLHKFAVL